MENKLFESILNEEKSKDRTIKKMVTTGEDDSLPNSDYYLGLDAGVEVYYNTPSKIYMSCDGNVWLIQNDDNYGLLQRIEIKDEKDKKYAFKRLEKYIDASLNGTLYDKDNGERYIKDPEDADEIFDKFWAVYNESQNKVLNENAFDDAFDDACAEDQVIIDLDTEDKDVAEDVAYEALNALGRERYTVDTFQMYEGPDDNYDDLDEDYRGMCGLRIIDEE